MKAAKDLSQAESSLRLLRQRAVQHEAGMVAAKDEFASLRAKARKESSRGEKLEIDLNHVSQPKLSVDVVCEGDEEGVAPRVSRRWQKATLKSLVNYYVHNPKPISRATTAANKKLSMASEKLTKASKKLKRDKLKHHVHSIHKLINQKSAILDTVTARHAKPTKEKPKRVSGASKKKPHSTKKSPSH